LTLKPDFADHAGENQMTGKIFVGDEFFATLSFCGRDC